MLLCTLGSDINIYSRHTDTIIICQVYSSFAYIKIKKDLWGSTAVCQCKCYFSKLLLFHLAKNEWCNTLKSPKRWPKHTHYIIGKWLLWGFTLFPFHCNRCGYNSYFLKSLSFLEGKRFHTEYCWPHLECLLINISLCFLTFPLTSHPVTTKSARIGENEHKIFRNNVRLFVSLLVTTMTDLLPRVWATLERQLRQIGDWGSAHKRDLKSKIKAERADGVWEKQKSIIFTDVKDQLQMGGE